MIREQNKMAEWLMVLFFIAWSLGCVLLARGMNHDGG